ncbi:cellulose binding domain-containing protein [Streptomyces sp. NPDC050564]|uniref:cellulose binding domain-containing protein n=1 Tax=Streptomyces sp. NPDC050564 TaxID=3365631 RepID=UPI00379B3635
MESARCTGALPSVPGPRLPRGTRTYTQSGTTVTAVNADHNGAIAVGGSASFGFGGAPGGGAVPAVSCSAT